MILHENRLQQTILMKYHALLVIFEKQQNLKLSSATNYRWRFKALLYFINWDKEMNRTNNQQQLG